MQGRLARLTRINLVGALLTCALLLLAITAFVLNAAQKQAFVSSEVHFADASQSGLSIVPASCPSSPHYSGECSGPPPGGCPSGYHYYNGGCITDNACRAAGNCSCTAHYFCSGSNLFYQQTNCNSGFVDVCAYGCADGACNPAPTCAPQYSCQGDDLYYRGSNCQVSFSQTCAYGCTTGGCAAPPSPSIVTWRVFPLLVQRGTAVQVEWAAEHVSSCTVTGTNGDSWTGASGSKTTRPIQVQTIYTITCQALAGAQPPSVTRSTTVNVIPVFCETGAPGCDN